MKIKPEDFRLATKIANIKDVQSTGANKQYWNSVYRLVADPQKSHLTLKTTDKSLWITWNIPVAEEMQEFDSILPSDQVDTISKHTEGGSYEITYSKGAVIFNQDLRHLPVVEEAQKEYPEVSKLENPKSFKMVSKDLSRALKFITPFIEEGNPQADKSVVTFYPERGAFVGGSLRKMARVDGVQGECEMSFKKKTARAVYIFAENISEEVEVMVTEDYYRFFDPHSGNELVVRADVGRFPLVDKDFSDSITDVIKADRKMLADTVSILTGLLPEGADRLDLIFKGQDETASLYLKTGGGGEDSEQVAHDEFSVFRNRLQGSADKPHFAVNGKFLRAAIEQMEGTTLTLSYLGKGKGNLFTIQDEPREEQDVQRKILLSVQNWLSRSLAEKLQQKSEEPEEKSQPSTEVDSVESV